MNSIAPDTGASAGRDLQKTLMQRWYNGLSEANAKGEKVAYLFISGNVMELLKVFDFHVAFPEVNALQCGIKRVAQDLILKAENLGYSSDVCGYVKNDIGLVANDMQGPFGTMAKPDLLVCTYSGCNTYIKWFEALASHFRCPLYVFDVPFSRGSETHAADIRYMTDQLRELISLCESITGRKYDEDKLKDILRRSREAEDIWVKILHSAMHIPSPFDAFFEAVFFMAPIYVLRGSEECVEYYRSAYDDIQSRLVTGAGPVPQERFRVVIEGPPPWPHFRTFWELFKTWGVVCVASSYSKVGGIWDFGFRHDPERPLQSLAEYSLECYTNYNIQRRIEMLGRYVDEYHADGLVIHSVKSCRAFSMGQADMREVFSHERHIPTLFIESDLADPRYFSKAQLKNRIDAFFETLEHHKSVKAATA
jgi:benzoyl-CoA reductase subunit B